VSSIVTRTFSLGLCLALRLQKKPDLWDIALRAISDIALTLPTNVINGPTLFVSYMKTFQKVPSYYLLQKVII